ncbi:MAG: hypothetical protein NXI30_16025 [bacterium]|nr:hypothetical protein [bacterium]
MSATKDGASLWSDTHHRTYDDIFKLQEEITVDVAAALDLRLRAATTAATTESFEAYDAYLFSPNAVDLGIAIGVVVSAHLARIATRWRSLRPRCPLK